MSSPRSQKMARTYLTPGFHSDAIWLEDQRDYTIVLMNDLRQNLTVSRFDPAYGFFIHELNYLKPYLDTYPEDRAALAELIQEGRVGTGGSDCQPAETVIGGEGIVRNIIYGRLFHEGTLGDRPEVFMTWDVFGHCAQLAQILARSRFSGCIWSKPIYGAHAIFWHQALDGTKLLFKRTNYSLKAEDIASFQKLILERYQEIRSLGFVEDQQLDCLDFKPPSHWTAGTSSKLGTADHEVVVTGTGQRIWFRQAHREIAERKLRLPVVARDYEFYHQGTGVSRIEFKIANRIAESLLQAAETFATVWSCLGGPYPDRALDKAWRHLLFYQHHDAITGPCCDRGYLDIMAGYREACELAAGVYDSAARELAGLADLARAAPSRDAVGLVVFNHLNWERDDVVRVAVTLGEGGWRGAALFDASGVEVPFEVEESSAKADGTLRTLEISFVARNVPSVGYKSFFLVPSDAPMPAAQIAPGLAIENEFFQIEASPEAGGGIVSLFDKEAGREVIDREIGPANELVAMEEDPDILEPAWELWTTGPKHFSRDYRAAVEVRRGPVSERLIVRGDMLGCGRRQEVRLYRGLRRIDCETQLRAYSGKFHLYAALFPTRLKGLQPVFEERFGATVKRPSLGKLDFRTTRPENASNCGARRGNQWFGRSFSARVLFGENRAYSLGMVSLITTHDSGEIEAALSLQEALIHKGIPVSPYYDDLDWPRRKDLPRENTIQPTPENFNADLPYGTSFRISLDVGLRNTYTARLLRGISEEALKAFREEVRRKGAAALFLLDREMPDGWPPLPVLLVSADNEEALKKEAARLVKDLEAEAVMRFPEDADLSGLEGKVDDYGLSILNRGNLTGSVENDGTIVLFLMHTCRWGMSPWGKDRLPFFIVPEWKTHNYHYALYPHAGGWSDAALYRRGFEYNQPLKVVQSKPGSGPLPPTVSFLQTDVPSFVMTALKPFGNPAAGFSGSAAGTHEGIIVRGYEGSGKSQKGRLCLWKSLAGAEETNLLEESDGRANVSDGALALEVRPFEIKTFRLLPGEKPEGKSLASLGPEVEPGVVYARHWMHNEGPCPIGNSAANIVLRGNVAVQGHVAQGGVSVNQLNVAVVNNYVDQRLSGRVTILAPAGWRLVPDGFDFDIVPNSHLSRDVMLVFPPNPPDGGLIKARLEHGGQTVQDVLEVGRVPGLSWEVENQWTRFLIRLANPLTQEVEGRVWIVSPVETWPRSAVGGQSMLEISPRMEAFSLPAGGTREIVFEVKSRFSAEQLRKGIWAVAKLAYNGRVEYRPVPGFTIEA